MLAATLTIQAVAVVAYLVVTLVAFFGADASSTPDGLAYVIIVALGALWVTGCAVAAWRAQAWARGAIITWQLVQLAVGFGSLEGLIAGWAVGIGLLALGLLGLVLALVPSVTRKLARSPRDDDA